MLYSLSFRASRGSCSCRTQLATFYDFDFACSSKNPHKTHAFTRASRRERVCARTDVAMVWSSRALEPRGTLSHWGYETRKRIEILARRWIDFCVSFSQYLDIHLDGVLCVRRSPIGLSRRARLDFAIFRRARRRRHSFAINAFARDGEIRASSL